RADAGDVDDASALGLFLHGGVGALGELQRRDQVESDDGGREARRRGGGVGRRRAAGVVDQHVEAPEALERRGYDAVDVVGLVRGLGADPNVRVVIVAAEGRGFCAGVDIKELQNAGHDALVGVNRGCYAAFAAVYECEVPVIAAVHGFCLGGGVGIVGNADIVIASADATFGLPEVDRGALGAATHLARLVPQHK